MACVNSMDQDQAQRSIGPDCISILFETQMKSLKKTDSIVCNELSLEGNEVLSILQTVTKMFEVSVTTSTKTCLMEERTVTF